MKKLFILVFFLLLWGGYKIYDDPFGSIYIREIRRPDQLLEVVIYAFLAFIIYLTLIKRMLSGNKLIPKIVFRGSFSLFFILFILSLLSSIYSRIPLYAAYRANQIIIAIILISFILDESNDFLIAHKLVKFIYIFAFINFAWVVFANYFHPEWVSMISFGSGKRVLGGFPFRRDFGFIPLILGIKFFSDLNKSNDAKKKLFYFTFFLFSLWGILIYRTRGIIFAFPICLLIILYFNKKINIKNFFIMGTFFIFIFIIQNYLPIKYFSSDYILRKEEHSLISLSGRLEAWKLGIKKLQTIPIIGYGYTTSVFGLAREREGGIPVPTDFHQAFLATYYELGLLGVIILMAFIIRFIKDFKLVLKKVDNEKDKKLLIELLAIQISTFFGLFSTTNILTGISFSLVVLIVTIAVLQKYILLLKKPFNAKEV